MIPSMERIAGDGFIRVALVIVTYDSERHLDECQECRALYGSVQRVLNMVEADPVPERGADYGAEVWRRIEGKLPARRWRWLIPNVGRTY